MLREAIATGETVEIAYQKALEILGSESAEFEILETPTKKTFGLFGGSPAKVRAFIKDQTPAEKASEYMLGVLHNMGLADVEISITEEPEGAALVLTGGDVGFVIGHRGETLDALQYLASLVANHVDEKYYRITLDVGNYREKRKETLESLGKKMALKSLKTGRNNSLEPMNPYERRIIHTAVQQVEGAKSWSEGEDLARHVVVGPVDGERYPRRDNNNRFRGGNNRARGGYENRGRNDRQGGERIHNDRPRNNYNKSGAGKPYERPQRPAGETPKRDDPALPVYGKINKD